MTDLKPLPRKRQRAIKACISCRQIKKKCDGETPCSTCARSRHHCEYRQFEIQTHEAPTPPSIKPAGGATPRENEDHSILDPERGRFFDASSAIAFPRLVGIQFGANRAPRLHSFAWQLGIRPEAPISAHDITQFISLDMVHVYSNEYFKIFHPSFDFLDQQDFVRRAEIRWTGGRTKDTPDFDTVICGVVALGSFFSQKADNGIEAALVGVAKERMEGIAIARPPTTDVIAAWILRALYLRATSRPTASWMASNNIMHLIESSGIQRDLSSVALIYPHPSTTVDQARSLYQRKVFWVGRAVNALFSYELSRPRVIIKKITCARVDSVVSKATRQLLELTELIPDNSEACDECEDIEKTRAIFGCLKASSTTEMPISLFRADLAFAAYRHLRTIFVITSTLDSNISHLLSIGMETLTIIDEHLLNPVSQCSGVEGLMVTPWWSLIIVPFHFILILLSLDTQESLSRVQPALATLQAVARVFDTHLTREAVQNATMLIRLAQNRKERDVTVLKAALNEIPIPENRSGNEHKDDVATGSEIALSDPQQLSGKEVEGYNPTPDFNGTFSTGFEAMLPDNLDIDWDAIFQTSDWI